MKRPHIIILNPEDVYKRQVFISHDMDEILEHCSVLTVLRDGDIVGELSRAETVSYTHLIWRDGAKCSFQRKSASCKWLRY